MPLRRRWLFALLSVVLLVVLTLLWPAEREPPEVPVASAPAKRLALPARPPPQAEPPPSLHLVGETSAPAEDHAGVAATAAAPAAEEGVDRLMAKSVWPGEAFAARCEEAGAACHASVVARYPADGLGGFFLRVERQAGASAFTVKDVLSMTGQESSYLLCMRPKLMGVTAPEPALAGDSGWVQCLAPTIAPAIDILAAAQAALKDCLRAPHDTLEFNVTWVLARTETRIEDVQVLTPDDAEAWERRCVEDKLRLRAALPADDRFDPPQRSPAHMKVGGPRAPTAKLKATPEGFVEYVRALPASSRDERIELLRQCTRRFPEAADCYALLGGALAKKGAAENDAAANADARKAYERFLEVAPPDDRRVERVRRILAAAPPP